MSSHSPHTESGALTDANPYPLGPLTAKQTQDALALYHSLPHHTASGEAVIRRAAATAYTNGFQDAKRCFAGATTAAPESAVHHAEPDVALLASIATCLDHGFGSLTTDRQKALLADARKVYDEVVGIGYYRQETRGEYLRWLSNEIPGGERDSNKFQAVFPEGTAPLQAEPAEQALTEAESLALAEQAGRALRRNGGIDWLAAGGNPKAKLLDLVANIERAILAKAGPGWLIAGAQQAQPTSGVDRQAHGRTLAAISREADMRCAEIFSEDARQMQLAGTYGALAERYAGCAAMLVRYVCSTSSQQEPDHLLTAPNPTTHPSEQA